MNKNHLSIFVLTYTVQIHHKIFAFSSSLWITMNSVCVARSLCCQWAMLRKSCLWKHSIGRMQLICCAFPVYICIIILNFKNIKTCV